MLHCAACCCCCCCRCTASIRCARHVCVTYLPACLLCVRALCPLCDADGNPSFSGMLAIARCCAALHCIALCCTAYHATSPCCFDHLVCAHVHVWLCVPWHVAWCRFRRLWRLEHACHEAVPGCVAAALAPAVPAALVWRGVAICTHTHRARAHSRPCVSLCACACTPPFDALQATTPCAASAWTTTITLKQRVCKSARVRVLAHAAHDAEEAWRVLHACV